MIEFNIIDHLKDLLPNQEDVKNHNYQPESYLHAIEVINLIEATLPEKETKSTDESQQPKVELQNKKKEMLVDVNNKFLNMLAEKVIPRIFIVYENNIQP